MFNIQQPFSLEAFSQVDCPLTPSHGTPASSPSSKLRSGCRAWSRFFYRINHREADLYFFDPWADGFRPAKLAERQQSAKRGLSNQISRPESLSAEPQSQGAVDLTDVYVNVYESNFIQHRP